MQCSPLHTILLEFSTFFVASYISLLITTRSRAPYQTLEPHIDEEDLKVLVELIDKLCKHTNALEVMVQQINVTMQ